MPRAAQTLIWSRRAQWMLEQCRARFGDMFTLRIAYEGTWVMVSDPEAVKQVFTGDPRVFHAGEGNQILRPILGENSVLVLDEKAHIGQRKLLLPPFHGERMQGYGETMAEIAAREIESWPSGAPYALRPRMQAITLEIILETVFGVHGGERMDVAAGGTARLPRPHHRPAPAGAADPRRPAPDPALPLLPPPHRAGRRAARTARSPSAGRRPTSPSATTSSRCWSARRHEDGSPMSDAEIRDELLTLLVAGHETTATALSWAMERLVRHPEKLERLRAEALAGGDVYLTATIQETLRLRPVIVLVIRRLTEPVEIGGYELPAGASVTPCIHLVHRNPEIYPEPDRFLPERFLDNPPGTYTWIPFGGGVRRCLGASFAQFEMAVVLRELVGATRSARPGPSPSGSSAAPSPRPRVTTRR